MELNVSALKTYQTCPELWRFAYVLERGPRVEAHALTLGKLWHSFIEARCTAVALEPAVAALRAQTAAAVENLLAGGHSDRALKLETDAAMLFDAAPHWADRFEGETLAVEAEMRVEIGTLPGGEPIVLRGIPDRVKRIGKRLVHVQTRTLDASTALPMYLEAAARDLHELLYAVLIQHAFPGEPYWGSEMNILRKLKLTSDRLCSKAKNKSHAGGCADCGGTGRVRSMLHEPHELFVQEIVPVDSEQVVAALADARWLAGQMWLHTQPTSAYRTVQNRAACYGRYGHSPCTFLPVCQGEEVIESGTFVLRESRYADPEPVAEGA